MADAKDKRLRDLRREAFYPLDFDSAPGLICEPAVSFELPSRQELINVSKRAVPTKLLEHQFHYRLSRPLPKSNSSNRSLIAGLLSGTYGLLNSATGLGKLSRLRSVTGGKLQFRSMNLRIDT